MLLFRKPVSTFRDLVLDWGLPAAIADSMKLLRLYLRVLELLGRETSLAWVLALADVALAGAMFMEPILFGRIVDTLSASQGRLADLSLGLLLALVGAWAGFGIFIIVASALVALH